MTDSQKEIYGEVPHIKKARSNPAIYVGMFLLFAMGVAFIYSTQSYNIDEIPLSRQFWFKQIIFFVFAGLPVYFVLSRIDYRIFYTFAPAVYGLSIILLIPLALKECLGIPVPFVESRYNATRWIDFGVISVQPSEIAKIGTCIMAAALFAKTKIGKFKDTYKFWIKLGIVFFIPILLIFLQPDLGSTLVFIPMLFAMLYISTLPKRFFAILMLLCAATVGLVAVDIWGYSNFLKDNKMTASEASSRNAYGSSAPFCLPMKDYQRNRILAFVAPDVVDPRGLGVSWNQRQSLISVGSGGILGKGHAQGTQAKLGYLPFGCSRRVRLRRSRGRNSFDVRNCHIRLPAFGAGVEGQIRAIPMHRNCGNFDDACFHKCRHDYRRNADNRSAAANDELWRNFRTDVLHTSRSRSKRLQA